MNNKLKYLDEVNYRYEDIIGSERLALEDMEFKYSGDIPLIDAIEEVSERMIPMFVNDIWNKAPKIKHYIDEAIRRGFTIGSQDIEDIFSEGIKLYYNDLIVENLTEIAVNHMIKFIDSKLDEKIKKCNNHSVSLSYIENTLKNFQKESFLQNEYRTYTELEEIATKIIEISEL